MKYALLILLGWLLTDSTVGQERRYVFFKLENKVIIDSASLAFSIEMRNPTIDSMTVYKELVVGGMFEIGSNIDIEVEKPVGKLRKPAGVSSIGRSLYWNGDSLYQSSLTRIPPSGRQYLTVDLLEACAEFEEGRYRLKAKLQPVRENKSLVPAWEYTSPYIYFTVQRYISKTLIL